MSAENRKSTLGKIAQDCMAYALFGVLSSLLVIYAESAHAQSSDYRVPSTEQALEAARRADEAHRRRNATGYGILEQVEAQYPELQSGYGQPAAPSPEPENSAAVPPLVLASSDGDTAPGLWKSTRGISEAKAIAHLYAIFCESSKHPARTKGCTALFEGMLEKLLSSLRVHDAESVKNAVEEYKRIYEIID